MAAENEILGNNNAYASDHFHQAMCEYTENVLQDNLGNLLSLDKKRDFMAGLKAIVDKLPNASAEDLTE